MPKFDAKLWLLLAHLVDPRQRALPHSLSRREWLTCDFHYQRFKQFTCAKYLRRMQNSFPLSRTLIVVQWNFMHLLSALEMVRWMKITFRIACCVSSSVCIVLYKTVFFLRYETFFCGSTHCTAYRAWPYSPWGSYALRRLRFQRRKRRHCRRRISLRPLMALLRSLQKRPMLLKIWSLGTWDTASQYVPLRSMHPAVYYLTTQLTKPNRP